VNEFKCEFQIDGSVGGDNTIPVVLATEYPVSRKVSNGVYNEILSLSGPDNVDLSRAPLPLIEQHDSHKLNIGVVEGLRVVGRKLRGMIRLGESTRAKEILQDIKAKIIRSVSVGYDWLDWDIEGEDVIVSRWIPYELSLVSVPADVNAGLYRTLENPNMEINTEVDDNTTKMTRSQRRRSGKETGAELERIRVSDILAVAQAFPGHDVLARECVANGSSCEVF